MKFHKALLMVFAIVMLTSCSTNPVDFPTGEYVDFRGYVTTFDVAGNFSVKSNDPTPILGNYSIEGNVTTVSDNAAYCPDDVGNYHWSVDVEGVLQFERIDDECGPRAIGFVSGLSPNP